MSRHCTDAEVRVLQGTYLTQPPGLTEQQRWAAALDAVAPAIAARAKAEAWDEGYSRGRIEQADLTAREAEGSAGWPGQQKRWLRNSAKSVARNFGHPMTKFADNPYRANENGGAS